MNSKQKFPFVFTFVKRDSLEVTPPFIVMAYTLTHAERKLRQYCPKAMFDVKKSMMIKNPDFVVVPRFCTLDLEKLLND